MKPIITIALLFITTPVHGAFFEKNGFIIYEQRNEDEASSIIRDEEPVEVDVPVTESTSKSVNEDERVEELKKLIERLERIIELLEIRLKYE